MRQGERGLASHWMALLFHMDRNCWGCPSPWPGAAAGGWATVFGRLCGSSEFGTNVVAGATPGTGRSAMAGQRALGKSGLQRIRLSPSVPPLRLGWAQLPARGHQPGLSTARAGALCRDCPSVGQPRGRRGLACGGAAKGTAGAAFPRALCDPGADRREPTPLLKCDAFWKREDLGLGR